MKSLLFSCIAAGALALGVAGLAGAATTYTPYGNATVNPDGSVTLVSDTSSATPYGGLDIAVPSGLTVNDLTQLSATFTGECGGGSPRFQLNVGGHNVFVYLGDAPNFTSCGAANTGNLLTSPDARFDLSQYGGSQYSTWADVQTLLGSQTITGIQFVVDSGWFFSDGSQTVTVSNIQVNGQTVVVEVGPPTSKAQCKNGGWQTFNNPSFRNQGQCVSYVNHHNGTGNDDTNAGSGKNKKK